MQAARRSAIGLTGTQAFRPDRWPRRQISVANWDSVFGKHACVSRDTCFLDERVGARPRITADVPTACSIGQPQGLRRIGHRRIRSLISMKSVQKLMKEARGDREPWIELPLECIHAAAKRCGPTEIDEVFSLLLQFDRERRELPEWDGDSVDDIRRAQRNFSRLLSGVPDAHLPLVAEGLKSENESVRFYTALALRDRGAVAGKQWLQMALLVEEHELNRQMLREGIDVCSRKRCFHHFFGGKMGRGGIIL
jgi:hypothetical protein